MRRIFATFDADGFARGFYPDDFHAPRRRPVYGPAPEPTEDDPFPPAPIVGDEPNPDTTIPAEAIEISEGQYTEILANQGRRRWEDGRVVVFAPPAPEPAPAELVSMRQAKLQLSRVRLLAQADAAIAAMEGQPGEEARIEWEYATELRRDHPLVAGIGQALGLDEAAIDALFEEASKIM